MQIKLALFDLDNTLLSDDSDYLWGQFMVSKGLVDADEYERTNRAFYAQYQSGDLDINAFLEFALKPLSQYPKSKLDAWHKEFMQAVVLPLITPAARQLVEKHREAGHTLMIITATNRFVTGPIAAEFGIEHLIATDPAVQDGEYTGKVSGVPSFQSGKITRLEAWLKAHDWQIEESWFYSDSLNDIPLLEKVDHPFAVDPDEQLAAHAEQHGWPILSLRSVS